jgi:hypothetical protein
MKRTELKKVELMAVREESTRLSMAVGQSVLPS